MISDNATMLRINDSSTNVKEEVTPQSEVQRIPRNKRAEYWADFLKRHSISGLTIKEFCFREGVSTWSFYTWRRRLKSSKAFSNRSTRVSDEFVELFSSPKDAGVYVDVAQTFRIIVSRNVDPEALRVTLKLAKECAECSR